MALEVVEDVAAEVAAAAIRGGLGVEDDKGVGSPGARNLVAGGGDVEAEKLVTFINSPVQKWVGGLRRRGRSRGSNDAGDVGRG